jgi:ankyrin repeat protein
MSSDEFLIAVMVGNAERAKELLCDPRVDFSITTRDAALFLAADRVFPAIVDMVLGDPRINPLASTLEEELIWAVWGGNASRVEELLADPLIDPTFNWNLALLMAAQRESLAIVEMLAIDQRINSRSGTSDDHAKALRIAAASGQLATVELLLRIWRIDSDYRPIYDAVIEAAKNGHVAIVQRLLQHQGTLRRRVPTVMAVAAANGQVAVVEMLLRDPRIDPSDKENTAVIHAARNGHAAVVELLLRDPRVDPSDKENTAVIGAAAYGHSAVVELLLRDPRVDPSAKNNRALWSAATIGYVAVVALLLRDSRIDWADVGEYILMEATSKGNLGIVELLLRDPRQYSWTKRSAVGWALDGKHLAVVDRLLCDVRQWPPYSTPQLDRRLPLRAMRLYAPRVASVLSRLGFSAEVSSSVLKQSLRLTGLKKKDIEALMKV